MEDEAILLKIKRQFTNDESVGALLKIISQLRIEIGVLKSEVSELKEKNHKITSSVKQEGMKTKKEWLKEDIFQELQKNIIKKGQNEARLQKQVNEWRDRHLSHLASLNK